MTDKMQVQITQIENGFLVAFNETRIVLGPQGKQTIQVPCVNYCENYEAVCVTLKSNWPKE